MPLPWSLGTTAIGANATAGPGSSPNGLDAAEHDVSDNLVLVHRHQRQVGQEVRRLAQRLDKPAFLRLPERLIVDTPDRRRVSAAFRPDRRPPRLSHAAIPVQAWIGYGSLMARARQ